jgi:hypothetical protein
MNAKSITAVVLLVLFVLSLPLGLAVSSVSSLVFNQQSLTKLLSENVMSDQAMPGLLHEITVLENYHGAIYKPFDLRMMVNVFSGIERSEWLDVLNLVLPEKDRLGLVDNVVGGLFTWFDNEQPYPEITIAVAPIVERVKGNVPDIAAWIFRTFHVPACDAKQIARYEAGEFGTDVQGLVTCQPPAELKDTVIEATAGAIGATIAKQPALPVEIRTAEMLRAQMLAEQILAQKRQLNSVRRVLPLLWIAPVLFLLVALALTVRSVKDLAAWVRWPFFAAGALGGLLVGRFGDPAPMITKALLPPPEALIPTPAVAILLRLAHAVFSRMSTAILWVCVPLLILGALLLAFAYRASLRSAAGGLAAFVRSLAPPTAEAKI